jgi:hypothetical protein
MPDPVGDQGAAQLALEHFRYAGLLSALFAAGTVAYLGSLWRLAPRQAFRASFPLHTLFYLWQTNVAFVAVVALANGSRLLGPAGDWMSGWYNAPLLVPAAAVLYTCVLLLCMVIIVGRGRSVQAPGKDG